MLRKRIILIKRAVLRQLDNTGLAILLPQLNLAGIKTHILYMEHERKN